VEFPVLGFQRLFLPIDQKESLIHIGIIHRLKPYLFRIPGLHSGYLYYIDGYKKYNRSSQTTVIDIKTTALKNAIEWHWSHTSE
jgi:hypothetical protein